MKIAYIMYPGACYLGKGDGSKMQAEIWAKELEHKGHNVVRIDSWGHYDWNSFDIVHVFGLGLWNYDIIHWGSQLNKNFVFSPIIDTNIPMWKYRLATFMGCSKFRLFSQNYILRQLRPYIRLFFARTQYGADYLSRGYGIPQEKIAIVPLSYRNIPQPANDTLKEDFCLFVGTMTQERKNVRRLIDAAKKYHFRLILVGNTGNEQSRHQLLHHIGDARNIEIKGFVSDEELQDLYLRAKVFSLPSLNEGVGLVALEAAIHDCNIVITNLGGPKEYYPDRLAYKVNPYDIDDIGKAIVNAMNNNTQQPALKKHIMDKYNVSFCTDQLINYYETLL